MFDWPGGSWQDTVRLVLTVLSIYGAIIWVALIFWVFRDIRQRTRDPVMQIISVLLVLAGFLPGHWIYLILRPRQTLTELYERSLEEEAILQYLDDQKACPACRRRVRDYIPRLSVLPGRAKGTLRRLQQAPRLRLARLSLLRQREASRHRPRSRPQPHRR